MANGVRIAHTEMGSGPPLVSVPPAFSHLELNWDVPAIAAFQEELARHFTLVLYDRWGSGLSDRVRGDFSIDADVRVLEELVDHLKLRRFALWGVSAGGRVAILYSLSHPRRISQLLLFGTWASPPGPNAIGLGAALRALMTAHWELGANTLAAYYVPGAEAAALDYFARLQREAVSADMAVALSNVGQQLDLSDRLPNIRVPTLVINRREDRVTPLETARQIAAVIPDARLAALDGAFHIPEFGDQSSVIRAILGFSGGGLTSQHGLPRDRAAGCGGVRLLIGQARDRPRRWPGHPPG
jgi:pimeloyl-ACP methyl ester carboxylesterase